MGIGYLLIGFLFLINPVIHVLDILPDCIGFFLIVKGLSKVSLFIALLRKVILIIPLALILPRLGLGVWGIYLSEPISDVISATTAGVLLRKYRKKLLTNGDEAV